MFQFFRKKPPNYPVDQDTWNWLGTAFLWLSNQFGSDVIKNKKVLVPDSFDFPVKYDGSHESAFETLKIVAQQMDTDPSDILLEFYSEGISEFGTGGVLGNGKLFVNHENDAEHSSGLYHGMGADGKYRISIEEENLRDPEGMVATLAHEIAHIKLLGENRLKENNEDLTDLTTIIFGLGVFNANSAFRFNSGFDKWEYQKKGYLTQIEWGAALAVYTMLRNENSPSWTKHLCATVNGSYKKSWRYIEHQLTVGE